MSLTIEERQMFFRALDCADRIASAVSTIAERGSTGADAQWREAATSLARLYEKRGAEWSLTEDEVAALMAVAKLSKVG